MVQDPNDNNFERQQDLIREQEVFRLQQQERQLKLAKRRAKFGWIRNSVLLLIVALEILLALRFFLRLTGANVDNQFARFIYNLSDPFIAPFATLFISPTTASGTHIFDLNTLVALMAYGLLGSLVVAVLNYLQGQEQN